MRVPSGDHAGSNSSAFDRVNRRTFPVKRSAVKRSEAPGRIRVKTTRSPPGDQSGSNSSRVLFETFVVSWVLTSYTQMSQLPARSLSKATFSPSGDQTGSAFELLSVIIVLRRVSIS